ncbi:hypothetical protein [Chamaesiphon minutus]|nr:hypothetical protein [Chamaesiphon minutus]
MVVPANGKRRTAIDLGSFKVGRSIESVPPPIKIGGYFSNCQLG